MVTLKSKTARHDWSDENALLQSNLNVHDFESIGDNQDMQSIVSHEGDNKVGSNNESIADDEMTFITWSAR